MTNIAGSGSICQRHGSEDPDPPQNIMDPQHWFKESKKQYSRIWSQFRDFVPEHDFELAPPAEDSFSLFFNFLRQEKKFASSTLVCGPTTPA